ncbi:hypothetical protein BLOT_009318, partial [Blomia tropicalis]
MSDLRANEESGGGGGKGKCQRHVKACPLPLDERCEQDAEIDFWGCQIGNLLCPSMTIVSIYGKHYSITDIKSPFDHVT